MNFFSILQTRKWLEISLHERQKKRWLQDALTTYKQCMSDERMLAIVMVESEFFEKNERLLTEKDLLNQSAEEILLLCLQSTRFVQKGFLGNLFKKTIIDTFGVKNGSLQRINGFFSLLNLDEEQQSLYDQFQKIKISLALYYTFTHSEHIFYYDNLAAITALENVEDVILGKKSFERMLLSELTKNLIPSVLEDNDNEFVMVV